MKKILPFLLLLLTFTGCSFLGLGRSEYSAEEPPMGDYYSPTSEGMMGTDEMKMMSSSTADSVSVTEDKIIKTGNLSLHVDSVRDSLDEIKTKVTEWGGEVLSSNVNLYTDSYYGTITVRVPSEQFEVAFSALKDMAVYVESENTNAENITEQYMDLNARLNNLKEEEAQYLEVLDKAVTVEDILKVTDYLSQVRYEIESAETQLKYYDTNVDYSTIYLTLSEDASVENVQETWTPESTWHEAMSDWFGFLQNAADTGIYALIFGWPVLILLLVVLIWRRRSRTKKHK